MLGGVEAGEGAKPPSEWPEVWAACSSPSSSRPIFSSAQRQSLFRVESAYALGISQVDMALEQWRERVQQGKVVAKFGARVESLMQAVRDLFLQRTLGSLVVRERAERLKQLEAYIASSVTLLYKQQLVVAAGDVTQRFEKNLLRLLTTSAGAQSAEDEQLLLRSALFQFRTLATDLGVPSLNLSAEAAEKDLQDDLIKLKDDFPESPAARLAELQRMDREVKRPRKKSKGKRAVNLALSLVGMLRPPGFGSFQGFAGYATSLFGLPFDILMGVQNDGDSAEVTASRG